MDALTIQNAEVVAISVLPTIIDAKQLLLVEAGEITAVNDAFEADCATQALRKIKALQSQIERSRKDVKKPVLELGRRIDSIADEFCVDLESETSRLTKLLNAHVEREMRARQEEERKAREAAQEAARKAEAERRRQEAEARRLEEDRRAAEAAAAAPFDEQEKAEAAAKLKAIEEQKRAMAAAAQAAPLPVPAVPKPPPPPAKEVWHFRVNDIAALYAARPDLVRLSENVSAIQADIKGGMRQCPGLEIWSEVVAKV